ncbi:uncharacterized protein [Lolium perenne]|uniref:uncharacterized protein n=1 Tax=Lolium perenne TaxID=4522 RepID=UPI0021EB0872|nr:uncharacterized protein LOC127334436 [Lolium perenne]XP_051216842.1 uncharacterized protein LOC127334436 [Lolium perenne]
MGGFVDPFIPSSAWPQDMVFAGSSSWAGTGASSLVGSSAQGMGFYHLQNGSSETAFPAGGTALPSAELHEQFLLQSDGLDFDGAGALGTILPCPVSLTDSAPLICSSNESSGSEQSGAGLPQFLMGAEHPAAWPPACLGSMAGDETSTQSFGFGGISDEDLLLEAAACAPNGTNRFQQLGAVPPAQLQLHDDAEFSSGKLLSFSPGQHVRPGIDTLHQMNQNDFSGGLRHLDLSSLVHGPQLAPFNPKLVSEDAGAKINGNGVAGSGGGAAPKPRARARRGQATDPHSIAERLRREKISDRMKNLQELVPNSNKTDKASMLEEIIEYIKFLQLQTKVLSMSRLGATEAVVPLLMESQDETSGLLLGSPRSRSQPDEDNAAFEQEVAQLMENNMTMAMQYLQSKGLCLMPIGLASALSTQKGTASAAIRPETTLHAPGVPTEMKFKTM